MWSRTTHWPTRPARPPAASASMNPQRRYKVQVWGQGDLTYMNGMHGKLARHLARGIIPFINETACF